MHVSVLLAMGPSSLTYTRRRFAAFLISTSAGMLGIAGCNDTAKQKTLAVEGVFRWGELYNNREWENIYRKTDERFKRKIPIEKWLIVCEDLWQRLGTFQTFQRGKANCWALGPVGIVWAEGAARFEKRAVILRADWRIEGDSALLWNIEFRFEGQTLSFPGFSA
jgi:hypothetical protein